MAIIDISKLSAFSMEQVENLGDYCKNALEKEVLYLTAFDVDRLLAGFRITAGLDTKGAKPYEGWEVMLIGGHTLGHYLSAMAQAYVNPGVNSEDKNKIFEMLTECVDGLLKCQNNSKGKPGFVFGAAILDPKNVEIQFDNIEKNMTNIITEAWVPWYTLHKILAGLVEVYDLTGYEPAFTVAKGIGDWSYNRTQSWDEKTHKTVIGIEFGGMNEALYELYRLTGDDRYAVTAHMFDPRDLFLRVESGDTDVLNNHHANTTIPKFIGALNRYIVCQDKVISGEKVDASEYLSFAKSFWKMVIERHTYVTGGNSEWEHFGADYILDKERTNCNCETCNIYNMLKLSRMLFIVTKEKKYLDYYENAYYNTILSSQNPETGMTTYFQPMATGFFKVYGERFNKFWCCTGTGMENFTKLNDGIFFHDYYKVFVNLYESARLEWKERNLILEMHVDYNDSPKAKISVKTIDGGETEAKLALRYPDWISGNMTIKLNGEEIKGIALQGFIYITELKNGDEFEINLPAQIVARSLPDNKNSVAFKYGPFVLGANLGTKNMETTTTGVNVTIPAERVTDYDYIVLPESVSTEEFIENANDYFEREVNGENLSFTLKTNGLVFTPHYLRYRERYGLYFILTDEKSKTSADSRKVIDTIQPGYGQYENDEIHQLTDNGSVGTTNGETSRYATAGGSFSYYIVVEPSEKTYLSMTLLKSDNGKTIQVASGETILYSETLCYEGDESSYEVLTEIPDALLKNAKTVYANYKALNVIPITFSGIGGEQSAKVTDFIHTIHI